LDLLRVAESRRTIDRAIKFTF
ncbi:unnamed protein product, partial [methanotrophic bacterial endosymbiont of Bathymodiolus sp.]